MDADNVRVRGKGKEVSDIVEALKELPPNSFREKGKSDYVKPDKLEARMNKGAVEVFPAFKGINVQKINIPDDSKRGYVEKQGEKNVYIEFAFKGHNYCLYFSKQAEKEQ
jgi:hypothetical protein